MKKTGILYRDIADDIKRKIFDDTYPLHAMIPTENELGEQYGVSKITVRNAVDILVKEGYLNKQSGRGTFVISNRPFNRLSKAESFSTILDSEGKKLTKKVLSVTSSSFTKVPTTFADANEEITRVDRVYLLNDQPFIYFTHFLRVPMAKISAQFLEQHSMYQVLKLAGVTVSRFEDSFTLTKPAATVCDILKLDEPTAMKRVRLGYNEVGELVEDSLAIYNTAVHPYTIEYEV